MKMPPLNNSKLQKPHPPQLHFFQPKGFNTVVRDTAAARSFQPKGLKHE
jgi:hypothetical protein